MQLGLQGRTAVVTGGSRGIGRAIARVLAAEGARTAIVARSPDGLRSAADGSGLVAIAADLATEAGCEAAVAAISDQLGEVDILVNNLGGRAGSNWDDTGAGEIEATMAVNLYPAVRLSRAALPAMRRRRWGRVVIVSSIYGRESGGAPAYNAAKAAEISVTKSLARDVARDGVTVNCVAPGSILFEGGSWARRQQADPGAIADFVEREMPLGRFGTPEEVAAVVAFLCSEQASLVTGACIPVDGAQGRSNI